MARRHSRFVRPAPSTKLWIGFNIASVNVAGTTSQILSSLTAAALLLRPFTILRTRLTFHVETDQIIASEKATGAMGLVVVTSPASAVGVTAVPTPVTEPNASWFVYEGFTNRFRFVSAVGVIEPAGTLLKIDSKAMRKVGDDDDVVQVIDNTIATGIAVTTQGRILIKLH